MGALRKFSAQAEPEVLDALQAVAEQEGRQFEAVLDEALREYVERKRQQQPLANTLLAFKRSLDERDELYRLLAK